MSGAAVTPELSAFLGSDTLETPQLLCPSEGWQVTVLEDTQSLYRW